MAQGIKTGAIPKLEVGELVGVTSSNSLFKVLAFDPENRVYWCKSCPGTKYFTFLESDMRKLA